MKKALVVLIALMPILLAGQIGIYFTFDNGQVVNEAGQLYYEFDCMVYGQNATTKFGELLVLINYNANAFGTQVNDNGNATITPGAIFNGSPFYAVRWNDNQLTRLAIGCEFLLEMEMFAITLPATPVSLFHVKFKIQDPTQQAGLWYSASVMNGEQFYADHWTQYNPVIASDTLNETLPVELASFNAMMNNAYTGVNLTWVTHSESNLIGYGVYRGETDDLSSATNLNAFVEATNTSQTQVYMYCDYEVQPDQTYYYWLESRELTGSNEYFGPTAIRVPQSDSSSPPIPIKTGLTSLYPNPFNPDLRIGYSLDKSSPVKIVVANLRGQVIRTLVNENKTAGMHEYLWDGSDNQGRKCSSGMYLINMIANGMSHNRKVMLMK